MTTTKQITIWCDWCANLKQYPGHLIKQAEWYAKKEGWTVIQTKSGKRHYCERCTDEALHGIRRD